MLWSDPLTQKRSITCTHGVVYKSAKRESGGGATLGEQKPCADDRAFADDQPCRNLAILLPCLELPKVKTGRYFGPLPQGVLARHLRKSTATSHQTTQLRCPDSQCTIRSGSNRTDSQRFKIARFESQPQIPLDSLWCLYCFCKCLGFFQTARFDSRNSVR